MSLTRGAADLGSCAFDAMNAPESTHKEQHAMAEPTTSHTQQTRDTFRKAVSDHAERVESVFAEMAKLEEKGLEHAAAQLDEATRLTKVSLAYASELAAQWRKLAVDAARRSAEMVSGPTGG
jgi:hypothetical protein